MFNDSKEAEQIIQEQQFNISTKEFLPIFNDSKCSLDEFNEYVDATIYLFMNNRISGNKTLISLQALLRSELITKPLKKIANHKSLQNLSQLQMGLKFNSFAWIALADRYPQNNIYSNGLVIVPLISAKQPWYDSSAKRLEVKKLELHSPRYLKYKNTKHETFSGKWRASEEYNYARTFINKQILRDKGIEAQKFIKIKDYKGVKNFSIVVYFEYVFFIGKTSDYLKLHKIFEDELI